MNPELLALPFDHYQRYGAAASLISAIGGAPVERVLEVGANRQRILKDFIPHARFVFSDLEAQEPVAEGDDVFVQADATRLPFADREFGAVVSLDVMEHIPPGLRATATREMARVADRVVIIGCPLDFEWVHRAEERANAVWQRYFGEAYPWLEEHKEFGLVDPVEVVSALGESGFQVVRFGQGDVDVWAGLMASHFVKEAVPELAALVATADRLYNEAVFSGDRGERAYREFFVAVRDPDDFARLSASHFLNAPRDEAARKMLARLADELLPVVDRVRTAESQWSATAEVARALEADRDRLAREGVELRAAQDELRAVLKIEADAARDAESQSAELVRHSAQLVESATRVRQMLDSVTADLTAVRGHRELLAARVTTLERRQRVVKWAGVAAVLCALAAAVAYRIVG